jgi:hypothetical protein
MSGRTKLEQQLGYFGNQMFMHVNTQDGASAFITEAHLKSFHQFYLNVNYRP